MNIAILIPCTSNKRDYTCLKETDLFQYFFKSFFTTYSPEHNYTIYLGLDDDDKFYQNLQIQAEIQTFISVMKNTKINIYSPSYANSIAHKSKSQKSVNIRLGGVY